MNRTKEIAAAAADYAHKHRVHLDGNIYWELIEAFKYGAKWGLRNHKCKSATKTTADDPNTLDSSTEKLK